MKNLTHVFLNAKQNYDKLDESEIHNFVSDISKTKDSITCDWDDWAGEEWVSVMEDNRRVAIISVKIPIIFLLSDYQEKLQFYEIIKKLYKVVVDDFDSEIWEINLDEYKDNIPELEWLACEEAVNTGSFSTLGLWYATI